MNDLTGYFITTDRAHAIAALEGLRSQGILRPLIVRRNVRPYLAAVLPTLDYETPYSLILNDDTILRAGVAQQLVSRFREMRVAKPQGFKLSARVYDEAYQCWEKGGVMLFYTPHLRQVGWPEAPHVAFAQDAKAIKTMWTSKDDHFLGPIAQTLDFATLKGGDVRRILAKHGVKEAAN